jgi:arylamine N-acetyltransferase
VNPVSAGFVRPDPSADLDGYLARLGLERPDRPDPAWLAAACRAHMERVPYENLEIQLGRATSVDPVASIARIAAGGGGYCFHLNGAFGTLLAGLGYRVTRHLAQVFDPGAEPADASMEVNHQALVVRCEGVSWFVDCGLGNAPYEPIALDGRGGPVTAVQDPFAYRLEPWTQRPGGWRFVHDPKAASFATMRFAPEPVEQAAFAEAHERLSGSPESGFVRSLAVGRLAAAGIEVLRGRVLTRIGAGGREQRVLDTRADWFGLLADLFGLELPDVDEAGRARLWERVSAAHAAWLEAQAARPEAPADAPAPVDAPTNGSVDGDAQRPAAALSTS